MGQKVPLGKLGSAVHAALITFWPDGHAAHWAANADQTFTSHLRTLLCEHLCKKAAVHAGVLRRTSSRIMPDVANGNNGKTQYTLARTLDITSDSDDD